MKKLSSRDRILAAMNLQKPDRVPLMCQFSIGSMMTHLKPNPYEFWYDKNIFADGLVKLCKMFKFDGILVSLHGHSEKWRSELKSVESQEDGSYKLNFTNRTEIHSLSDLPLVKFKNEKEYIDIEDIDIENDIKLPLNYIPVSHNIYFDLDMENMFDVFDIIYSKVGESVSIHGEITSPFDYFLDLLGYQDGMIAMMINPEKCKHIIEKFTLGVNKIANKMCDKNIDAIKISSPFAGMGFISLEQYEEFVLPYEKMIIETIRNKGKKVYIHTCGSIGDRLETMCQSGTSGLECLDPEPLGNVDLKDAFDRIGKQVFIKGNIDSVNTLLNADDKKAEVDIQNILSIGKNYGNGFILSTACSIAPKVTTKRLEMLYAIVEKYGYYE